MAQIAAGEVVANPAAALKELVENAFDASCTSLVVHLERGGLSKIEVIDDGIGMSREDLQRSVQAHYTSKLRDYKDLFRLNTLGFRGEALHAISSAGALEIESRAKNASEAFLLNTKYNNQIAPSAIRKGTRVQVHKLFENLPARREFVSNITKEERACLDVLNALALSRPWVRIEMHRPRKGPIVWPAVCSERQNNESLDEEQGQKLHSELKERLNVATGIPAALWTVHDKNNLQNTQQAMSPINVRIAVAPTRSARRDRRATHVFLNGRWMPDPGLLKVLRLASRPWISRGQHPPLIVWIDLPQENLDVNVHPQKLAVRLRQDQMLHETLFAYTGKLWDEHGDTRKSLLKGVHPATARENSNGLRNVQPIFLSKLGATSGRRENTRNDPSWIEVYQHAQRTRQEGSKVQGGRTELGEQMSERDSSTPTSTQVFKAESRQGQLHSRNAHRLESLALDSSTFIVREGPRLFLFDQVLAVWEEALTGPRTTQEEYKRPLLAPMNFSVSANDAENFEVYETLHTFNHLNFSRISVDKIRLTHAPKNLSMVELEEYIPLYVSVVNQYFSAGTLSQSLSADPHARMHQEKAASQIRETYLKRLRQRDRRSWDLEDAPKFNAELYQRTQSRVGSPDETMHISNSLQPLTKVLTALSNNSVRTTNLT